MKKIVLLGASGSIGLQTIDVCIHHKESFEIVGLSVGHNIEVLKDILTKVSVSYVCTAQYHKELVEEYPNIHFFHGDEGLLQLVSLSYDVLVNALVGFVGLLPTLKAIELKKDIAIANKETLVVAGKFVSEAAKKHKVQLLPIDSEHSAIWQCLKGNDRKEISKLIITASGGSFRDKTREELKNVTVKEALKHPNWNMGAKITIDSATMMNKGFEVIEAHWLFDIPFEDIEVVMHPESIIHSMVQFKDHSVLAQLGLADMRLPIQYALTYPNRLEVYNSEALDLKKIGSLHFKELSFKRFPLLKLAYEVGKKQGTLPAVLNAANEEANALFLKGKIRFLDIEDFVMDACKDVWFKQDPNLEDILKADALAREYVRRKIEGLK